MPNIEPTSPLAFMLFGMGMLVIAVVCWMLPLPYSAKRVTVGGTLVLAGLVPISCGFCGLTLVGMAWQSLLYAGVLVALGLAAVLVGIRLLIAGSRYQEPLTVPPTAPPTEPPAETPAGTPTAPPTVPPTAPPTEQPTEQPTGETD